jgi:predicted nucleic acid-binding protein
MPRLRLVVDTNVVVSVALKPISLPADALFFSFTSGDLYVSPEILEEYEEILSRPNSGSRPQS